MPQLSISPAEAEALRARVLYRDPNLLILDKPAGLSVDPGPATPDGETLAARLPALAFDRAYPPEPAHRLDRDTSGCLVLARHARARRKLGRLFEAGRVAKAYLALVAGGPGADEGVIDRPLAKRSTAREGWRMVVDPAGRPARTRWRVLARGPAASLLLLEPETGRTHQLRAHLASLGCPILGDPVYGDSTKAVTGSQRLCLHALRIAVPYHDDPDRPTIGADAPVPADFRAAAAAVGAHVPEDDALIGSGSAGFRGTAVGTK
ncbi:MAG: RNA pseudouridine synthase [Azospirillaceae bacterium]